MDSIKNLAFHIRDNGLTGAHDLIFLTRYAYLADDKRIGDALEQSLSQMSSLPADAFLAYAYGEYYEYSGSEYCAAAADFVLQRVGDETKKEKIGVLMMAYARCAAAFGNIAYLEKAAELAGKAASSGNVEPDLSGIAFAALGFTEMYRTTLSAEYLQAAELFGNIIADNFRDLFRPEDAYDLGRPCGNSAVAVLYDTLFAYTGKSRWEELRQRQNKMVAKLAEKYPESISFGLCALLADEFGRVRVLCEVPEGEAPKELQSVLAVYSPNTYITVEKAAPGEKVRFFLLEKDGKKEIRF